MRYKAPYTLYKRGKVWYYRTYDKNGVRTHGISTACTSKSAARAFCDKLLETDRLLSGFDTTTYTQYAEHFFDDDALYIQERKNLSKGTIATYRASNKRLMEKIGSIRITEISNSKVKELRMQLQKEGYSVKYITVCTTVLQIVLNQALNDDLINKNPCDNLPTLLSEAKERDAFTLDEVKYIYTHVPEAYQKYIILFALTGMRFSELLATGPEDVKTISDMKYIDLQKQIDSRGVFVPLKTKKGREIPIIDEIIPLLGNYESEYKLRLNVTKILESVDPERNLSFHSFRHFFITNTKSSGISPLIVETVAGHSLKGIEGTYTHFQAEDCKAILDWQHKVYEYITKKESIDN